MSKPFSYADVQTYLTALVPDRPAELQRMEAYAAQHGFPIIGPAAGQFCYQIARMVNARSVFELGSGYGYSTAWFGRAVQENGGGEVHHVVWDEGLSAMARDHLAALGMDAIMRYHVGEAVAALATHDREFDLIFNDIEKQLYPASIATITPRLRRGGVLIIDNMIRSGRVFDEQDQSADTRAIRATTEMLTRSDEWIASLVPIRDGLLVAVKR